MTAELEKTESGLAERVATVSSAAAVSRRALLRGAAIAVPTVLTLHSGSAFALSSNLIGAAPGAPKDPAGNYLCLDVGSTAGPGPGPNVFDLGTPPYADVARIPSSRTYRTMANAGRQSKTVTGPNMCSSGGKFYYQNYNNGPWKEVNVKKGVLVSATALSSFSAGGGCNIRDI